MYVEIEKRFIELEQYVVTLREFIANLNAKNDLLCKEIKDLKSEFENVTTKVYSLEIRCSEHYAGAKEIGV